MPIDLKPHEIVVVKSLLQQFLPGVKYRLFGSRVNGTAKRYSDLDIALMADHPIPLASLSALEEAFSESDLPFKVDLMDWQRITAEFRAHITPELTPI